MMLAMPDALLALLCLLLAGWIWFEAQRAQEWAVGLARQACARRGVQLLDETVALGALGLRWSRTGPCWRRRYRFEYSADGNLRSVGEIVLCGTRLESLQIGNPEPI